MNNTLFMNKIMGFGEVEKHFTKFYKEGMDIEGAKGFDLFDEYCKDNGLILNKTPIEIHEGDNTVTQLYGPTALTEVNDIVNKMKETSNFKFTKEYIKLACGFIAIKCDNIMKEEFRKPTLEALTREAFGEAAMISNI